MIKWYKNIKKADILFYIVISYVLIAGAWWSYLLYIKNNDAFEAKKVYLWSEYVQRGATEEEFLKSKVFLDLEQQYTRQQWMIQGEGVVLLVLMVAGIWRVYQGRRKELDLARQQQNFLLSITHELKSPIASIQLVLETLQRRKLNPDQLQRLTHSALKDANRLHKLVQDLLLAARMEGGYQYSFEILDFRKLVNDCILLTKPKFKGEILLNIDGDLAEKEDQFMLEADKTTIASVVLNLIENAIKYAPDTDKIILNLLNKKERLWLEVVDYGTGIPKTEKVRIFDKFYRLGDEHTRQTKGTGLGLFITKKIVEDHKGTISVHDNEPQGTCFRIRLPLLEESI
ncbi:MAG: HAMP domain-containing histidine kinase [Saprospiraceae bacterium]|nr:HAMP domain-containing histidine kinase [Saprospiraceae bacterium]